MKKTLLATLRRQIIRYSQRRKTKNQQEIKQLEKSIEHLDLKVSSGNATTLDIENLADLNCQLVENAKEILKGAYIRSRVDWLEYGEKPSKFFLNLENKDRINKNISEIKLDNDQVITKQKDIHKNLENFHTKLYQRQPTANNIPNLENTVNGDALFKKIKV